MKQLLKNFALIFLILFIAAGIWGYTEYGQTKPETVGINRLVSEIQSDQVSKIEVEGSTILATLDNPEETQLKIKKESGQAGTDTPHRYPI